MIRKNHKYKHNIIEPEKVNPDELLSFSFNPEEQPLFEKFYCMRLNNLADWSRRQKDILSTLRYAKVSCVLEISRKGRMHMHGFIKIHKIAEFYLMDLKKLMHYGTLEIDSITNVEKWYDYIYKCSKFMRPYCERNDMVYEIGDIDEI